MELQKKNTLTVDELAVWLGISRPKAYELTEQVDFPVLRVGRRKLVPISALERWVDEQVSGGRNDV